MQEHEVRGITLSISTNSSVNEKLRPRVGFVSYWGRGRGQAYLSLSYVKMLQVDYDIYILKQGDHPIAPEFTIVKVNVTSVPNYQIDEAVFRMWITENKLDYVVLSEYKQWYDDDKDLRLICKEMGVKCFGILVLERLNKECAKYYDRILCSTITSERAMRLSKVRNFSYAPYGVDLRESPSADIKKSSKFTFLHVGGFGGAQERKNTRVVIDAFRKLHKEDTKLIISMQADYLNDYKFAEEDTWMIDCIKFIRRDLSRQDLINLYHISDCVVLPSKWETIGIPILEALAAGKPVVTTNAAPMNEFIKPGLNGYLCAANLLDYEGISILAAEVDVDSLANNMESVMNPVLYPTLAKNARQSIEKNYNIEYCAKFIKNIFKGEY